MRKGLEDLRDEIAAAMSVLAPKLEGLRNYSRLDLQPATMASVVHAIRTREQRLARLQEAEAALGTLNGKVDNLDDDGHPTLPTFEISADSLKDLEEELAEVRAGREEFMVEKEAVGGRVTFGSVDKD